MELAAVLERLDRAGMTLKPLKCTFRFKEVEYLGHELGKDCVRPFATNCKGDARVRVPQGRSSCQALRALGGLLPQVRRLFRYEGAPLTKLLRKSVMWTWGEEQEAAFETLKTELIK